MEDAPGQHPRELNPYWKNGGSGLPEQQSTQDQQLPRVGDEGRSWDQQLSRVGDEGHSWIRRAYKRALQAAEEEGRSLEEVAIERWGSLKKLHSLLKAAGIDPTHPDHNQEGRRQHLYSHFDSGHELERERESSVRAKDKVRDEKRNSRRWGRSDVSPSRMLGEAVHVERDGRFLKPGESNSRLPISSSSAPDAQRWRKQEHRQAARQPLDVARRCMDASDSAECMASSRPSLKPGSGSGWGCALDNVPDDEVSPSHDHGCSSSEEEGGSKPVTDSHVNAVSAKLMKAEMMGDCDEVHRLKKELTELRRVKDLQGAKAVQGGGESSRGAKTKEILLTATNHFGHIQPVSLPSSTTVLPLAHSSTHTKKGKREKFFSDDDKYTLKALVEQEREVTAEEMHASILRMSAKFVPAAIAGETVDDVVDTTAAAKHNTSKESERCRQRAMQQSRRLAEALENCRLCFGNSGFSKSLLVAVGLNTYLAVPAHHSLVEGHCLIVPMEHASNCLLLDENIWSEILIFRKGLVRMLADCGKDVVFMETCRNIQGQAHTFIDVLPLPREAGELAPMYFKKAILESDEEWAQNRKLIDTSKKGLRQSIPIGLPYFSVDFGLDGGYAHVIEDLDKFPVHFGREIVGGLLDIEPRFWLKPSVDGFEAQQRKVKQLAAQWAPYDWTQQLKDK